MAYVKVNFTHNIHPGCVMEKRIVLSTTIGQLKSTSHSLFGTPVEHMRLVFQGNYNSTTATLRVNGADVTAAAGGYGSFTNTILTSIYGQQEAVGWTTHIAAQYISKDEDGGSLGDMSGDDYALFGSFNPHDGCVVHVIDSDPGAAARVQQYTDVSAVEKYEISEEDYAKRKDSARVFKQMIMAQQQQSAPPTTTEDPAVAVDVAGIVAAFPQGSRCKVFPGDRLGTVRYCGLIPELKGSPVWIGVELDEPGGKNNGSIKGGKAYFKCAEGYGCFAKPDQVTVGDFPPEEF